MEADKPLRVLVVDDERLARKALCGLLARQAGVEVVGEAGGVDEAAALIRRERPDVVLLDVQLRGETGFDLLARVPPATLPAPYHTVFVTAFDAYAVRAFEVHALDYLLKPVDPARLADALAHARRQAPAPAAASTPAPVATPTVYRYDDFFFHDDERRPRFIRIRDVAFVQAAGNYTELHLHTDIHHTDIHPAGGPPVLVYRTLAEWEEQLPAAHFVRVHRSLLVNLGFVERIERGANYTYALYLKGRPDALPMSRRRALELKDRF